MGLRVIAIDTGAEKKALCEKLGAERWIDFKEEKDIVKAVKAAAGGDGLGPHGEISVYISLSYILCDPPLSRYRNLSCRLWLRASTVSLIGERLEIIEANAWDIVNTSVPRALLSP